MPANTEVVLRIGADVTDLQGKLNSAQGAVKGFSSAATTGMVGVAGASQQMAGGFQAASRGIILSAGGIGKAFESMPRGSAFNLINTQLASMAYQMTGTSQAGMALASAIGIVERATISMGAGVLPMVAIMASIAGLMALAKLATEKSSKALDEYIKKTKEANEENKKFTKDLTDYIGGTQRYNRAVAALHGSFDIMDKAIHAIIPWWTIQNNEIRYITESTNKFRDSMKGLIGQMDKVGKKRILEKFDALIYQSQTDLLKRNTEAMLERNKAIEEANKKQAEQNRISLAGALPMGASFEKTFQDKIKYAQFEFIVGEQILKRKQGQYVKEAKAHKELQDKKKLQEKQFQDTVGNYVNQISGAFANSMMGIKVAWGDMIKSMIAQLIASGITNWIMKLLFPPSLGLGAIASIIGYQGSGQHGIPYVPKTGGYYLHKGEAVIPASQNISNTNNNYGGGITYNILAVDWDKLTQDKIVPFIEKMSKDRRTRILTV